MRWTRLSAITLALSSTTQKPTSLARSLAMGRYLFLLFVSGNRSFGLQRVDAEPPGEGMLRHRSDPRQRREIAQLVGTGPVVFEQAFALAPDRIDGLGLRWMTEADPRRRAAIERAHAALERATSDGRRDAGMADRLD